MNDENASGKSIVIIVCFLIVVVLLIASSTILYYLSKNNNHSGNNRVSAVIPTVKVMPTATTIPTPVVLEREGFRIAVLNGSGTVGAARAISTRLTELGYNTTIGNATGFAYRDITIKIKKDKENYLTQLQQDISEGGTLISSISASVDDTIPVDAQVIVGR